MQVLKAITRVVPVPCSPIALAAELLPLPLPLPPVLVAPPMEPPVPVGFSPLGISLGERFDPRVRIVGFDTADADGTEFLPDGMAWMLLEVALNTVGASEISLLSYC
jgi:hypothetical protein